MTAISASLVKELRDATGAGMMECKRALEETGGDIEAARVLLRERGLASAAKRAGRQTSEGIVGYRVSDHHATMVAVGCETEPVSKNEEFQAFAKKVLDVVDAEGAGAEAKLEDERQQVVAKLGENIVVAGAARFEQVDGGRLDAYVHPPANKLAMHIAASAPQWIAREDVPGELVDSEREIYANSDELEGKPEQAREKIVEGMLNKRFFAAQVLGDQPWIHDDKQTVAQVLADEGAEVLEFERFALAG